MGKLSSEELRAANNLHHWRLAYRQAREARDHSGMLTLGQLADANQRIANCAAELIAALEAELSDCQQRRDEPPY